MSERVETIDRLRRERERNLEFCACVFDEDGDIERLCGAHQAREDWRIPTTEVPIAPGRYWYRPNHLSGWDIWWIGGNVHFEPSPGAEWAGPIPEAGGGGK